MVFCDLRVLVRKLASPFATQGMSLRKFNLSLFAILFAIPFAARALIKCVYPICIDILVVSSFADRMDSLGFSKVISTNSDR